MKMKTYELTGEALDWAVAKCESEDYIAESGVNGIGIEYEATRYSTDWTQGGPIIDLMVRDGLRLTGYACLPTDPTHCQAQIKSVITGGPTPLIAAMRCYVASKLGDTVDVPKELTQ